MIAPAAKAEFASPLPEHKRHGGIRLGKRPNRPVALFHLHIQIATLCRRVEVFDGKGPRRDEGFIDNVAVLRDRYFGIAVRHTANHRRKTPLAVGQHFIVRHQLYAAKWHAIEYIAGCEGIANPQQAVE